MFSFEHDENGNYYFLMWNKDGEIVLDSRDLDILIDELEYCPWCGQRIV